jgi:hypothetical protein
MNHVLRTSPSLPTLLGLVLPSFAGPAQDWVIPSGLHVQYDTRDGPVLVDRLIIERDAILSIVGRGRFLLTARRSVDVAGTLDLCGTDNPGVGTIGTANIPEPGANGGPEGRRGGVGSWQTGQSTPRGGEGEGWIFNGGFEDGGQGGESGYSANGKVFRRAAGGGGGAFGPDRPSENTGALNGLVASPGFSGGPPPGLGAESQTTTAQGGAPGEGPFRDGDPANDFWGRKRTNQGVVQGELSQPRGGAGGGAGGDAVNSNSFPLIPFVPSGDEKGSGGGGGGGLGSIITNRFVLEQGGRVLANGGSGGGGENTNFFDRIGGGSGGGSGGMLVIQARLFDLRLAELNSLQAVGGRGGVGADNSHDVTGAGGDGGPGLIQLHTAGGSRQSILLPANQSLEDLSLPDAHVLLPARVPAGL